MPERRILKLEVAGLELRRTTSGRTLAGYAAVFESLSEPLGGFVERISPGAIRKDELANVVATFNHNPSNLLGKTTSGTLQLSVDDRGLLYRIDLPDTGPARDLAELVERGDVEGSSFTFDALEDAWSKVDGVNLRTLKHVRVHEVGPVVFPAYPDTTAAIRSLETWGKAPVEGAGKLKGYLERQRLAELLVGSKYEG